MQQLMDDHIIPERFIKPKQIGICLQQLPQYEMLLALLVVVKSPIHYCF
jgi:hypothetical protein